MRQNRELMHKKFNLCTKITIYAPSLTFVGSKPTEPNNSRKQKKHLIKLRSDAFLFTPRSR